MPPGTRRPRRSLSRDGGRPGRVSAGGAAASSAGGPAAWPPPPPLRPLTQGDAPMTPGGHQAHVLSPEVAGDSRRATGVGRAFSDGAGVSRRPSGRAQVFSPGLNPSVELGTGALGLRLTRFSEEVAGALAELGDAVDTVHGRVVGVETSQRALIEGAPRAVEDLLLSARNEIGAQSASLGILRGDVVAEATAVRVSMAEMRQGMEVLYAKTKETRDSMEVLYTTHHGRVRAHPIRRCRAVCCAEYLWGELPGRRRKAAR